MPAQSATQIAVAGVCVALLVLALARFARSPRFRADGWALAGAGLWVCGLGLVVRASLRSSLDFPHPGHLFWVIGIPVALVAIARAAPRNYRTLLVGADVAMVSATWLLLAWHTAILPRGGPDPLTADYARLGVLLVEIVLVVVLGFLAAHHPVPHWVAMAVGAGLLTVGDALAASLATRGEHSPPLDELRLALVLTGAVVVVGALILRRAPGRPLRRDEMGGSRRRTVVSLVATVMPLGVIVMTVAKKPTDPVSITLALIVLGCLGARGALTSYQTGRLLERLSTHTTRDPLTGLGNRHALAEALTSGARAGTPMCLLNLDIDRFKEVNRQVGHGSGDRVLKAVAAELTEQDLGEAFRLGGDEFAVLSPHMTYEALATAERVRVACARAIASVPDVAALALTVSVGVAGWQLEDGEDPLEMLTRSALALRAAKKDRDRVWLFTDEHAAELEYRDALEQCLRQALAEGTIEFFYQPIVRMSDGVVVSVESLARWSDPVLGVVSPAEFVAVAEETGLIDELGRQALESAATVAQALRRQGLEVSVSVNVSPVQLRRPGFDDEMQDLLRRHAINPELLTVEVTEGVYIDVDDPASGALDRLSRLGFGISIDDFGSGYSSLGYITRLPATVIKIDRMLTQAVDQPRSRSIVAAILGVAAAHGLQVVLEGVETAENAAMLHELGAELAQGWLFSPAVAAEHLAGTIENLADGAMGVPSPRIPSG